MHTLACSHTHLIISKQGSKANITKRQGIGFKHFLFAAKFCNTPNFKWVPYINIGSIATANEHSVP